MMLHSPGLRALALIAGLSLAASGSALAQDTTETGRAGIDTSTSRAGAIDRAGVDTARDTTDTSGVQNPPGYRGMERDTTMVPPSRENPSAGAGQVEDRATGTYDDSTWQDTSGTAQNPAGYRGMERPAGDTAAAGRDTTSRTTDTTKVGETTPRREESPARRLEPTDSAGDSAAAGPR
jgi:hypothetical protein